MRRPSPRLFLVLALSASCAPPAAPAAPVTVVTPAPPPAAPAAPAPRDPATGPHGESAVLAGTRVSVTLPSESVLAVEPGELHPPPGDRSLLGIAATALLFLDDGTLVVGAADGTVTALDGAYRRRWSLGLRGAVRGLTAAGAGLVAVTTERGTLALLGADGRLRWERQVTGERLRRALVTADGLLVTASQRGLFAVTLAGELAFSHAAPGAACEAAVRMCDEELRQIGYGRWARGRCERERAGCEGVEPDLSLQEDAILLDGVPIRRGDPHTPVPGLVPSFPVTFRRVMAGNVIALLPGGPGEVLALATNQDAHATSREEQWAHSASDEKYELFRVEGGRSTRLPLPRQATRAEVILTGTKPERAWVLSDALVAGPDGKPWIFGRRFSPENTRAGEGTLGYWAGAGHLFELAGGKARERNELLGTFAAHGLTSEISAAPGSALGLFCFGDESPLCLFRAGAGFREITPPGKVGSVARIGDRDWVVIRDGSLLRFDGKELAPVPPPAGGAAFRVVAGPGERDVWASVDRAYAALHFDGAAWKAEPVPEASVSGFAPRAADEVWSNNARVRWDGRTWSRVFGAPIAAGAAIEPTALAVGRDDVWVGGDGLWHATAPGPVPVRLSPPATADEGVFPPAAPLPLAAPETRYAVERYGFVLPKGDPLTSAHHVAASADGVLWLADWNRVVEVDAAGKAALLRVAGSDSFQRWAFPEGEGRGLVLAAGGIQRLQGQKATPEDVRLPGHQTVAVHGDGRGIVWILGSSGWDDHAPHALVRAGADFQPVLGLPAAHWCDVAAGPDGGAFFAGGLSQGPSGEGILFQARGRLGSGGSARYRTSASLLAVTAVSAHEAWAVGAAGAVIHVEGGAVTRYALPSGEWLRAVHAVAADDVWLGGDGGTLVHYDGREFHPVPSPLGGHTTLTGMTSTRGVLWAVGPAGIVRIQRR
jgi:hypothetical protein